MQEQNENFVAGNCALKALQAHYEDIEELVNFKKRYSVENVYCAQIIMRNFSDNEHSILVDGGSRQGIVPDMVAVYKNCLVGRVTHVYPYYSKVLLMSDAGCKVAAYCRSSKIRGIHEGMYNKECSLLQFVSHLHEVKKDDVVLSSGEGLVFPQGFGLGKVQACEPNGLYHKITVVPLINVDALHYCYLIKKGE